jgi:hypothetical protein
VQPPGDNCGDFWSVHMRQTLKVYWTGFSSLYDVPSCEVRAYNLDHGHPHRQACRCMDTCRQDSGFRLIDVLSCKVLLNKIIKSPKTTNNAPLARYLKHHRITQWRSGSKYTVQQAPSVHLMHWLHKPSMPLNCHSRFRAKIHINLARPYIGTVTTPNNTTALWSSIMKHPL